MYQIHPFRWEDWWSSIHGPRGRIGETLALSALGRYQRRSDHGKLNELQRIAGQLHALSLIRPVIEAVFA